MKAANLSNLDFGDNQILSISFVGSKTIKRVNSQFVLHEGITDVIAFDYRDCDRDIDIEEVAGELIVYPGAAEIEAPKRAKSSFALEMTLYIVHGILHLAGEDDLESKTRKRMRNKERIVMKKLQDEFNIENVFTNIGRIR